MFEKRKNSDVRSGISLAVAIILMLVGVFVGLLLNQQSVSEPIIHEAEITDVDFSGEWIGTTTQDYGDDERYDYRIVIEQDGDVITGISYLDMVSERDIYAEERIVGTVDGNVMVFEEVTTLVLENTTMDRWCLTETTVTYQILNGQETLVGTWELADWEREECGEITGRVILTRQPE